MNRINDSDEKLQLKEEGSPSLHDIHNISITIMNLYRKYDSNLSHHWQDILSGDKLTKWCCHPHSHAHTFPHDNYSLGPPHAPNYILQFLCFFMVCEGGEITKARLRDKQSETNIMHGVSTLQGSKAYQRLARLHWAAAVA